MVSEASMADKTSVCAVASSLVFDEREKSTPTGEVGSDGGGLESGELGYGCADTAYWAA
eukprot:CAMPEP_0180112016 /NCGR_PEP_ID=MMETSP0985-20121206/35985_1 /TAXON_ID=483367 /ORGANISM="non described non described, Strain CCMP 2436" /LENGTH=58 /DNA_ID=CAMNT_0022050347 /DNA_START=800 /DNA_END=976 /DNA_ORIENTATION=+